jgi:CMP-N-acetylneuraminic acid synthetase
MKILITICARGGSKGIPGKNIKDIAKLPLIAYSINAAKKFSKYYNCKIALSTDSDSIKHIAEKFGLKTDYTRPDELATDSAGKIGVLRHLLLDTEFKNNEKYDYILDLDITSPLRTIKDLIDAFKKIESDSNAVNLFSVSPSSRSPYFNMVEQKENGYYSQVKKPAGTVLSRQMAPKVYDLNASFYFYKRIFFELNYSGAITDRSLIYEVPHLCFDLDHPIDFEFLSFLIENNKLGFEI